jgi:hypothetical protein
VQYGKTIPCHGISLSRPLYDYGLLIQQYLGDLRAPEFYSFSAAEFGPAIEHLQDLSVAARLTFDKLASPIVITRNRFPAFGA